jgi:aminoglycoside 2''-phosphotransferase
MSQHTSFVEHIKAACPDLAIETVHWNDTGQFNHVMIVNGETVFRFPRYAEQARSLPRQASLLRQIRGYLNVAIPDPIYEGVDSALPGEAFIGYPMIPGIPLRREMLAAVSQTAFPVIVGQIATFLHSLHGLPTSIVGTKLPNQDGPDRWVDLYARIRKRLFSYMRPSARSAVTHHFEAFLGDPRSFEYQPVIRHGDFGTGNILFDPTTERIRGIIDFDFAGPGDPATDLSVVLDPGGFGEEFAQRFRSRYPLTEATRARADFYRGTWALQEALHGIEASDRGAFERGIARYRCPASGSEIVTKRAWTCM